MNILIKYLGLNFASVKSSSISISYTKRFVAISIADDWCLIIVSIAALRFLLSTTLLHHCSLHIGSSRIFLIAMRTWCDEVDAFRHANFRYVHLLSAGQVHTTATFLTYLIIGVHRRVPLKCHWKPGRLVNCCPPQPPASRVTVAIDSSCILSRRLPTSNVNNKPSLSWITDSIRTCLLLKLLATLRLQICANRITARHGIGLVRAIHHPRPVVSICFGWSDPRVYRTPASLRR